MRIQRIAAYALTLAITVSIAGMGAESFGRSPALFGQEVSAEILTATKSKNSSAEKYMDELRSGLREYSDHASDYSKALEKGDYKGAEKALDKAESALKSIGKLKAPSKYASNQKKLAAAVEKEQEFVELEKEFIELYKKYDKLSKIKNPTKKDEKEAAKLAKDVEAITEKMESLDTGFGDVFLETVKAVKADIDG